MSIVWSWSSGIFEHGIVLNLDRLRLHMDKDVDSNEY